MKVTLVSIRPTEAAEQAARPSLTPELLAATSARYSRSNEGLEKIISKIDPHNLDKSVDSIFKMIDYGHRSIADMAPISIFMDQLSMWLVYYLWTLCPTAGGQESSTRYIRLTPDSITPAEELGLDREEHSQWQDHNLALFDAYEKSLALWEQLLAENKFLARIPASLLADSSTKAKKTVYRMQRNYAFDRARYFLPFACRTNVTMVMAAKYWADLAHHLLSHPLLEANTLGRMICEELALGAPRMIRHANAKESTRLGIQDEFTDLVTLSNSNGHPPNGNSYEHPVNPYLLAYPPPLSSHHDFGTDLAHHENRYAWIGAQLRRTGVRFGWQAVALAEVRDLNRHRTGNKYCPLNPVGFYCAEDQIPETAVSTTSELHQLAKLGHAATLEAKQRLAKGDPRFLYYMTLGTQVPFEHFTTANHYIYQAELRTGTGAHYRYADHLRDTLKIWYDLFPETKGKVLEGSAEPE